MRLTQNAALAVVFCIVLCGSVAAGPSLTIYNQNFAVVRDTVELDLERGTNKVTFTETTAHLEPASVILRDPAGEWALQILEQSYRADPVSEELLLSLYEGKTISFQVRRGDQIETVQGKIIRSGYVPTQMRRLRQYNQPRTKPIIQVAGKLQFGLPGTPLFPALADDTILKPTLHWLIETDQAGKLIAELAYITGAMSWEADYNLVAPEKGDIIDLVGWITMNNQSGKTFKDARIKLMAGDVSKIQEPEYFARRGLAMAMDAPAMAPPVTEKAFDEYHLYTLRRTTTLRDRETKQVEFVRAAGVKSQRLYVYDGAWVDPNQYRWGAEAIRQRKDYGTRSNKKVWVMREFDNSKENNLGIPLPRGRVRFYRRDEDQLEFVGENIIDHTPKDETIRIYTGNAFDITGERKQTSYKIDEPRKWLDESFEIKLRNHKEEEVEVRVVEHLYRWSTWELTAKSHPFTKTDARTIQFRVKIPADGERKITYTAHYTW